MDPVRAVVLILSATPFVACALPAPEGDAAPDARSDATTVDDRAGEASELDSDITDSSLDTLLDSAPSGVAPEGTVPGERSARDGANPIGAASGGEAVFRVEAMPSEHVAFVLTFAPPGAAVVMQVDRWDGSAPRRIGVTDAGAGLRVLAVRDPSGPRTYWVRVRGALSSLDASLAVTRTPFEDGPRCMTDCARLLQLPLPNDPRIDGYATDGATVFRYQFGRRDLLMFLRYAGRRMVAMDMEPFVPQDLSQWDGQTPGVDVGSPRHASHQRGKDVDISLYGTDGRAPWRSYCVVQSVSGGRECVPGSMHDFSGLLSARLYGAILESGRVTMSFLDRELIPYARAGAAEGEREGTVDPAVVRLFSDGVHLQHWPNHDNHIHVRVSESTTTGPAPMIVEPFEAP